jgi:carbon monoxide dehydrogenase subunit G
MAKFQISETIEINRPAETVFQYLTDVPQAPSWRPNLSVRDFSGEPFEVGTTWAEVTKFMGREVVVNFEVTALEAGRHFETKQEGAGVSGNLDWNVSPGTDDSSTFTLSFDGELSGWIASLATGMLRNQAQKDMKRDLTNLKSNLESG